MARAAPLHPEERRAAILAATERLIVETGGSVSTSAIAAAAGIAEGTIFRVFPTKDAIIEALFEEAYSPHLYKAELAAIDMSADLEIRMIELIKILQQRMRRQIGLFTALGFRLPPSMSDRKNDIRRRSSLVETAAILAPDRNRLRFSPIEAARLLQSMVVALSLPQPTDRPDTPEEMVDLILHGIGERSANPPSSESSPC